MRLIERKDGFSDILIVAPGELKDADKEKLERCGCMGYGWLGAFRVLSRELRRLAGDT